jgi:hypothetical protein
MIPDLVEIGASWKVLPPGIHDATLEEVGQRFAGDERRRALFQGLQDACRALAVAGCRVLFLDGSYVTEKPRPGDYDVCWDPTNVGLEKLDPVLLDFSANRQNQKLKFGGEFFPSSAKADGSRFFTEYFRRDKETGREKGIIRLLLGEGMERVGR